MSWVSYLITVRKSIGVLHTSIQGQMLYWFSNLAFRKNHSNQWIFCYNNNIVVASIWSIWRFTLFIQHRYLKIQTSFSKLTQTTMLYRIDNAKTLYNNYSTLTRFLKSDIWIPSRPVQIYIFSWLANSLLLLFKSLWFRKCSPPSPLAPL